MKNLDIIINKYDIIFWDFDGVIKDSNNVKLKCFLNLFKSQNLEIKKKIKQHHINNIGISRNKKIPIYLSWINKKNNKNIKKFITYRIIICDEVYPRLKSFSFKSLAIEIFSIGPILTR